MKTPGLKKIILILALSFASSACSYQWMESDSGASADEVIGLLNDILGEVSAANAGGSLQEFIEIKDNPNSTIYFAFGPGEMGSVASISSLVRYDFMGPGGQDIFFDNIEEVKIFFAYVPEYAGNKAALLIQLKVAGQASPITKAFSAVIAPGMDGEEYVAILGEAGVEKLVLRSYNVTDGDLEPVIQLRVSDFDSATGLETENGKFSVLEGFGGL